MNEQDARRYRANAPKLMMMSFAWMFLVLMPVVVIFFGQHGLDMEAIFQLQTIFAVVVLVLEVPSGYVADLLGRKGVLVAAGLLYGLGYIVLAQAGTFWEFAVFEVFVATAASLYSGADVALLYDSMEAVGDRETSVRLLGRKLFWGQTGETVAALLGGAVALHALDTALYVNCVTAWIPFLIALTLVEPPRGSLARKAHLQNFKEIANLLARSGPVMRRIMLTLITYGVATLVAVWVFQAYWTTLGIDPKQTMVYGLLWAAMNLTVALTARKAAQIHERLGSKRILHLIAVLPVVGYAGMALVGLVPGTHLLAAILGVSFAFCFQVSRGLTQVVVRDALNRRVDSSMRATANSVSSLGVRAAFAVLGPFMGWMIDRRGHSTGLAVFAFIFLLAWMFMAAPLARRLAAPGDDASS